MTILAGVVAVLALLTLAVAVRAAVAMVHVSPQGSEFGSFLLLGWWKFNAIARRTGPEARPHLAVYQRSVIVFVVLVVIGLVLGGLSARTAPPASGVAQQPAPSHDPSVIPAQFATIVFPASRAAAMPRAARQES